MAYIKMQDKRAVFFDVDSTLIEWVGNGSTLPISYLGPELVLRDGDFWYTVAPIEIHVNLMKEFKAVGWQLVVWSAGGADHAERVVKLLGMEDYVDLIVSKPEVYVDDLALDNQGIKRVFKVPQK